MIPVISENFLQEFTDTEIPSKDYFLDIENGKIKGTVEDLEQVKQAVYFMLGTERYEYIIYPWEYGVELNDLIGQPYSYVVPEIERRITECLTQDERINGVSDFTFEKQKNKIHVSFVVSTIFGTFEREVNINV
ncbi:MAG: DUF2634 domain-containing protein [Lachnospiraceae bacterium]